MKICLLGPSHPFRGGISHYTTLLYRHLKKTHNTVFISFIRQYPKWLFPGKTDIDPSQEHIQEKDVLRVLDSMNPFTWLKSAQIIIKHNPDLVIIPWWVSFWAPQFFTISFLIKCFSGSKIMFLCHNVIEHESNLINKILTKIVLSTGDRFLVHSEEDKLNLLQIFPKAVVRKTFHPTYDVFKSDQADPDKIKRTFNLKNNVILFFGFVRKYKGLEYLLKAMPKVLDSIDVTLLVVGEFWKDKQDYLTLIDDLDIKDHVRIVDEYVSNEEVPNFFLASDIVVQPYVSATGSGVIQTAYAFEKPVIATSVGCLPEVVENGKTGYLVPPCNSMEISKAIVKYFTIENRKNVKLNIRNDSYKFSWDRLVNEIEAIKYI